MTSTLYATIFERAEARGEARGKAEQCAETIVRVLTRKAAVLDEAVVTRIRSISNFETLDAWLDEAIDLTDADGARRLIEKIAQSSTS